jgi:hypothetical protein
MDAATSSERVGPRRATSIALACLVVPLSAGGLYFAIAAPAERPGVYLLTVHHEFETVPPLDRVSTAGSALTVRADSAPQPIFLPDNDDIGSLFVLAGRNGTLDLRRQAMRVFLAIGAAGGESVTLTITPLDARVQPAGDRLFRVDSAGWVQASLRARVDEAIRNGAAPDRLIAYVALRLDTADGGSRWYLARVGSPFTHRPERR